jgi:hypothetical protein
VERKRSPVKEVKKKIMPNFACRFILLLENGVVSQKDGNSRRYHALQCGYLGCALMSPEKSMRFFDPIDVAHYERGRKKISELKWLMGKFEDEAKAQDLWGENCTPARANEIYGEIFDAVTHEIQCARLGLFTWQSVYNRLSANERRKRKEAQEAAEAEENDNARIEE